MQRFPCTTVLAALLLLCLAGPSQAQYMKITTDNPADPTRLRSSGGTILTLTLDTIHDRDGSPQSCNSHTRAAGCMPPASAEPLDLFGYTITLAAIGGTVTWGTFAAADPDYEPLGQDLANDTQTEFVRFAPPTTTTPAGLITLGSITVAVVSGAPEIQIAHGTQTIDPFGYGTGFHTHCDSFQYPNTYLLGDPNFVCASGDWFDVDGAAAPAQVDHCPVSLPGGPYTGLVGMPLAFDGTASRDPDGNPLTYAWDFDASDGIGIDATGPTPSHTYSIGNTYVVTLTVTDNGSPACSNSATALATINYVCEATVFNGYEPIRLGTGRSWFALVQPASNCYVNSDVILSSFTMMLSGGGTVIHADAKKTSVGGDGSGDGIEEIRPSFANEALQALFGNRPSGTYLVVLEADLVNGAKIRGVRFVRVVRSGSFASASISPNPLNPEATLTYTTSRVGFVRIDMFDIQGRLVRRLVDAPAMAAGTHEAKIDGRGDRGERLPSGVYYIRGTSSEGEFKHLVTILK